MSGHDPYAPRPRPMRKPNAILPISRLERCGANRAAMDTWLGYWSTLDDPDRDRVAATMAVLTDNEMAGLCAGLNDLDRYSATQVEHWVRHSPDVGLAADLAMHVESRREKPRAGLTRKLAEARQ